MFHLREGIWFEGDDEGNVTIRVTETPHEHAIDVVRITVPASEWASVVASVSRRGENADTHRDALDLHTAPPEDDPHLIEGYTPLSHADEERLRRIARDELARAIRRARIGEPR